MQAHEVTEPQPTSATAFTDAQRAKLIRAAWLIVGSRVDAEDAVHDAWLSCSSHLADVDDPDAYLRRAVINRCLSLLRSRERATRAVNRIVADDVIPPRHLVEFRDLIQTLPIRQRTAVVLRYYCDTPDTEIATHLGCAEVTVRVLIHRALRHLRSEIEP